MVILTPPPSTRNRSFENLRADAFLLCLLCRVVPARSLASQPCSLYTANTTLLSFGNHRYSQETVQQIGKCQGNGMVATSPIKPPSCLATWQWQFNKTSLPSSISSYQPCCYLSASSADEFGAVLELQMLRASEALIPTVSLSEHRLISHASPLLKQYSICPGMQPKGNIAGDFTAQTIQQGGKWGGRKESLTHCELGILVRNCHYHVKYIINTFQRGGHGHAPSYALNPCKKQPQVSCCAVTFVRCSQVRVFSSMPSLHFGIYSSGSGSDSAQNTEVEPMHNVPVPQSCAQILLNTAAGDLLTNGSRSSSSQFC